MTELKSCLFGGSSSAGLSYICGYSGTVNANVKEIQDGMRECLRLSLEMNLIRRRTAEEPSDE